VISEGGQSIGVLFALGVVGALYAAVAGVRLRSAGEFDLRPAEDRGSLREVLGLGTVSSILLATVGGFSTVLALLGFGQVRTWNRISLFIAFFALLQVAIWIERVTRWAGQRVRWSPPLLMIATVLVCALALADGPSVSHPDYSSVLAQSRNDQAIVDRIENLMPAGSAIIQVPPIPYPESRPPGRMRDYDPLRPYLADEKGQLRWSYGRIEGRPEADWQSKLTTGDQMLTDLPALLGMGFTGLWVDTYGYPEKSTIPGKIQQALHEQPIASADGRFQFFDLRPLRASLAQSDRQLKQLATATFGISPPD
jgi:phosphoglycerol transferase